MASSLDIGEAVRSGMEDWTNESLPDSMDTDQVGELDETTYMNDKWQEQWGYFNTHPELKSAVLMKAIWMVGKGYTSPITKHEVILSLIRGTGKSTFRDILYNMTVVMLVGRDSYAEIIKDEKSGTLLNLKVLNTGSMRHVYDKKGMIKRYEQVTRTGTDETVIKFKPEEIFHLSNNMLADQSRGISVIESLDKTLLAELESFDDTKKVMRRQAKPFIIFKLKTDDNAKITALKTKIDKLRELGEDLYIPDDDDVLTHAVVEVNPSQMIFAWRQDITNRFYRALGMPLIIFGSSNSTESGSKMEYFAHEQVFEHGQKYIEDQVFNQLFLIIDLIPPQSMAPALAQDTLKDGQAQQLNTQQSDVTAGEGR